MVNPLSSFAKVARAAATQHHAISHAQIRALGLSSAWIVRNSRTGFLTRVDDRVFVVGRDAGELPRDTCAMVGILRAGRAAALGLESSLERLGLWSRGSLDIHVVTTSRTTAALESLSSTTVVHSHRTHALPAQDIILVDELPTVVAIRSIAAAGIQLTRFQLAHVIWNALYEEQLTIARLEAYLAARPRVPHTATARRALELVTSGSCGTKSASEDELLRIVERAGLPMPLCNVLGATELPGIRLDFVWPEHRVAFELDGRHHRNMPGIQRSDREVSRTLRATGWTTPRAHYSRVWSDPIGITMMLAHALGM